MRFFSLIFAISGIYVSSAFVRLELFASIGVIILGSIGLSILLQQVFKLKSQKPTKLIFSFVIITLFLIPLILPEENSWLSWADFAPTILNGGNNYTDFTKKKSNKDE